MTEENPEEDLNHNVGFQSKSYKSIHGLWKLVNQWEEKWRLTKGAM